VAIHYNGSEEDADSAAQAVRAFGGEAAILKCDLSKEAQTATLVDRAVAELGPLTALINSASLFENDDWRTATRKTWDEHIEINLRAPLLLSQLFGKQLPQGAKGNIINIIDQRVLKPTPQFLSYSISKAGLYWLTTTLAQGMGTRYPCQCRGPRPHLEEPAPVGCRFQPPARCHHPEAWRKPGRYLRCRALSAGRRSGDRPDAGGSTAAST
jgi:hypothetical protein